MKNSKQTVKEKNTLKISLTLTRLDGERYADFINRAKDAAKVAYRDVPNVDVAEVEL